MSIAEVSILKSMMQQAGAERLYVKALAPNDNSKNQPYFGGDFSVLNILPYGEVRTEALGKRPNFKAATHFSWLLDNGFLERAPNAQFILYPDYPEVRFSGFLKGCRQAPKDIMRTREEGRLLFLGVTGDGRILGYATTADTSLAHSFHALRGLPQAGVFQEIALGITPADARALLLAELGRICRMEWIDSKKLTGPGQFGPCKAPHCGGMTLEAELGIMPNGYSEPDFHGWEVKQHGVKSFLKHGSSVLTLMTPEPTAGFYKEAGVTAFIRKYGYPDRRGREDRLNVGGIHKFGERQPLTGLTLFLDGYENGEIVDLNGGVVLRDDAGNTAAEWKFANIIEHWKRKHAKAVYIPSLKQDTPLRYRYGNLIRLGTGTDPLKLLSAFQRKAIYYDPGIKLENASGSQPNSKRRSQFRVNINNLDALYTSMETVDLFQY